MMSSWRNTKATMAIQGYMPAVPHTDCDTGRRLTPAGWRSSSGRRAISCPFPFLVRILIFQMLSLSNIPTWFSFTVMETGRPSLPVFGTFTSVLQFWMQLKSQLRIQRAVHVFTIYDGNKLILQFMMRNKFCDVLPNSRP